MQIIELIACCLASYLASHLISYLSWVSQAVKLKNVLVVLVLGSSTVGLTACDSDINDQKNKTIDNAATVNDVDTQLRELLTNKAIEVFPTSISDMPSEITGDIPVGIPAITDPMAQLGKELFFSKALSGNFDTACVSCHHPLLGGGDALAVSIGVDAKDPDWLGPGREHKNNEFNIPRNAPTLFNIALWQNSMFWDSRVEKLVVATGHALRTPESQIGHPDMNTVNDMLAAQSFFPVTSVDEMRGEHFQFGMANDAVRLHLAARLGGYGVGAKEIQHNPWPARFAEVFAAELAVDNNGDADNVQNDTAGSYEAKPLLTRIEYEHIALALSAYQKSQVFVNNPWQAYVNGDNSAINDAAKQGAILFFTEKAAGGAGCAACHSGAFFTDEQHYVSGSPQIGEGKNNGPDEDDDFGRARETRQLADKYKFRTPTLLNLAVTAPYFHAGSAATLAEAIQQHAQPKEYAENYFKETRWCEVPPFASHPDCSELFPNAKRNTQYALDALNVLAVQPEAQMTPALSTQQIQNLVAFLNTLTDPCVLDKACLEPWLLDESEPESMQLLKAVIPSLAEPDN